MKKQKTQEEKNAEKLFSDLVDLEPTIFREYLDQFNVGYVMGLRNLFAKTYEDVLALKNQLVDKAEKADKENLQEIMKNIHQMYSALAKIEVKYFICDEVIKIRNEKNSGNKIDGKEN